MPFGCDENTETVIELTFSFDNIEKDNTILYIQKKQLLLEKMMTMIKKIQKVL